MAEVTTSENRSKLSLQKKSKLTMGKKNVKTPTKLTGGTEKGNIVRGWNRFGRRNRQRASNARVTESGQGGTRTKKVTQSRPNPNATGRVTSQGPSKVKTTIEARDTALNRNNRRVGSRVDTRYQQGGGGPRGPALLDPATRSTAVNNIKKALDVIGSVASAVASPKGNAWTLTASSIADSIWNTPAGPTDKEGNPIDERLLMEASQSSNPEEALEELMSGQWSDEKKEHILKNR